MKMLNETHYCACCVDFLSSIIISWKTQSFYIYYNLGNKGVH